MVEPKVYQLSDFKPLVGAAFTLSLTGCEETVQAELVEAEPCKGDVHPDAGRDPFALLFRLPAEKQIAQALYTVENEKFASTQIFLVPVNSKPDGYYLEAIFN